MGDLICLETKGSQHVNEVRRGVLRLMRITCQGSD
jgi:hypothetical protein